MTVQSAPSDNIASARLQTPNIHCHNLLIDGASDKVKSVRTTSPVNTNMTLPPVLPLEHSVSRVPHSASPNTLSSTCSQDTTNRPSTASSICPGRSRSSSKTDFRITTRGLINPEMAGRDAKLFLVEPDTYLNPVKHDPGHPPKSPTKSASFATMMNENPYINEPRSFICIPPPLSFYRSGDPEKVDRSRGMPQSRSAPTLYGLDGQQEAQPAEYRTPIPLSPQSPTRSRSNASSEAASVSRGRAANKPNSTVEKLQYVNEKEVLEVPNPSTKRPRSLVKRLLGLGKSSSLKDIAGEPQAQAREEKVDKSKRTGMKVWGDTFQPMISQWKQRFLHLLNPQKSSDPKVTPATSPKEVEITPPPSAPALSVCLDPPFQAKVYAELEAMICTTANRYLLREVAAGRVSTKSIAKVSAYWSSKNRPQVIEFLYDQATQLDLISYNLATLKFYGESAESAFVLSATMLSWKTMAKEMSVRTFCVADSAVRKHMRDAHKILEMLGAPSATILAFQKLQLKTLVKMYETAEKMQEERREERRKGIEGGAETYSRKGSRDAASQSQHS